MSQDNALQMDFFSLRRIIAADGFFPHWKANQTLRSPWFITAPISM